MHRRNHEERLHHLRPVTRALQSSTAVRGRLVRIPLGIATLWVVVLVVVLAAALVPPSASARSCRSVRVEGKAVLVQASNVSCQRARPIARRFSASGAVPRGWDRINPAGCEWVLFRRRDRARVIENGYSVPGVPTIRTVRDRGCTS